MSGIQGLKYLRNACHSSSVEPIKKKLPPLFIETITPTPTTKITTIVTTISQSSHVHPIHGECCLFWQHSFSASIFSCPSIHSCGGGGGRGGGGGPRNSNEEHSKFFPIFFPILFFQHFFYLFAIFICDSFVSRFRAPITNITTKWRHVSM